MGRSALFGERKVSRPANMMTDKQVEVLLYLWNFYEKNDQLPPVTTVAKHFGFASGNGAQDHITALVRKGWLEPNEAGRYKFSTLTRTAFERVAARAIPRAEASGALPASQDSFAGSLSSYT